MNGTHTHIHTTDAAGKILPRLSDMARMPAVRAFFRRGEGGDPSAPAIPPRDPIAPAPALAEMEVA